MVFPSPSLWSNSGGFMLIKAKIFSRVSLHASRHHLHDVLFATDQFLGSYAFTVHVRNSLHILWFIQPCLNIYSKSLSSTLIYRVWCWPVFWKQLIWEILLNCLLWNRVNTEYLPAVWENKLDSKFQNVSIIFALKPRTLLWYLSIFDFSFNVSMQMGKHLFRGIGKIGTSYCM